MYACMSHTHRWLACWCCCRPVKLLPEGHVCTLPTLIPPQVQAHRPSPHALYRRCGSLQPEQAMLGEASYAYARISSERHRGVLQSLAYPGIPAVTSHPMVGSFQSFSLGGSLPRLCSVVVWMTALACTLIGNWDLART